MTPEEKQILLQDLCTMLPYGVKASTKIGPIIIVSGIYEDTIKDETEDSYDVSFIKPYLRPLSSMTEEEIKEWDYICVMMRNMHVSSIPMVIKFVNSKHLDYIDLIPMGLALEAPKGMYNF